MRDPDDYVGVDFPPMVIGNKAPVEFNFDRNLAPSDTLQLSIVPTWTIWVIAGADPAPSSRIIGSATIDDETATKTQQLLDFTGLTVGAYYGLRASVATVLGYRLSLSSRMRVEAPTP